MGYEVAGKPYETAALALGAYRDGDEIWIVNDLVLEKHLMGHGELVNFAEQERLHPDPPSGTLAGMATLSLDDARTQIQAILPDMGPKDVADLFSPDITETDAVLILTAYKDYAAMREITVWEKVLAVLNVCVQVAGIVAPIAGAVSSVFGVAAAIKTL